MAQASRHQAEESSLELLFRSARTPQKWHDEPVAVETLERLYALMSLGPTSGNCCPARIVFCVSREARDRLAEFAFHTNQMKIRAAPVTAVIGYDTRFYERLPELYPVPHVGQMVEMQKTVPGLAEQTAFRNGSLQGAYFIIAARSLGLDCGPMSGFDIDKVTDAFFPGGRIKANFLCSLGRGDFTGHPPRNPRPAFAEACSIL